MGCCVKNLYCKGFHLFFVFSATLLFTRFLAFYYAHYCLEMPLKSSKLHNVKQRKLLLTYYLKYIFYHPRLSCKGYQQQVNFFCFFAGHLLANLVIPFLLSRELTTI